MRNGTPDSLIVRFAREIRWPIVDSGTRNARAICGVVRPPTARSVRAIAEAGVSDGWQHMNEDRERVVLVGCRVRCVAAESSPTCSSRFARACSLRRWSMSRRPAVRSSHARGFSGMPSRGQ